MLTTVLAWPPDPSTKVGCVKNTANREINTGKVRDGAVEVNMKSLREVVNTKVIARPKAGNTSTTCLYQLCM